MQPMFLVRSATVMLLPRTADAGAAISETTRSGATGSTTAVALLSSSISATAPIPSAAAMMYEFPAGAIPGIVTAVAVAGVSVAPAASGGTARDPRKMSDESSVASADQ